MGFLTHAGQRIGASLRRTLPIAVVGIVALASSPRTSVAQQSIIPASRVAMSGPCVALGCANATLPDSDRARIARSDSMSRVPRRLGGSKRMPLLFFGALAGGLVANSMVHLDHDPGGYRDEWNTKATFPDKVVHGLASFALTSVGVDMKVRPIVSALATCAAGAAFETTQGYVSGYDIGADCAGAALAGLWRHWRAR
jgi:hypothetical protein